jgi:hypothetical protein
MTFHNLSILEPTLRNTAVSYRMLVRQNIFTDKVEGPYSCGIVPNGAAIDTPVASVLSTEVLR